MRLHDPFPALIEHSNQWNIFELSNQMNQAAN